MAKSSTLRMVLMAGGLVGAVVAGLAIKEHFFDREPWIDVAVVGTPCSEGRLDEKLWITISADGFKQQLTYQGGVDSEGRTLPDYFLETMVPESADELRVEVGVCRMAGRLDCPSPTPVGGSQLVKLDRTTTPAKLRVMFPGDLACRAVTARR